MNLFVYQQLARVLPPSAGAKATGIESVKLPFLPEASGGAEAVKARLDKAADDFENSDFLKGLKERSEQNREKCVSWLCHYCLNEYYFLPYSVGSCE